MNRDTNTSSVKRRSWLRGASLGMSLLLAVGLAHAPAWAKKKKKDEKPAEAQIDSSQVARMHLSWGQRYLKLKQYEDAEIQLTTSNNLSSDNYKTLYYLGRLYFETDRPEQAIEHFQKSLELNSDTKNAKNVYYYLGTLLTRTANREGAIEAYTALLGMEPSEEQEISYLHHLVRLYVEEGDYEKALERARRWAELKPNDPDVQDTVGKLALHTGEEDEALEQMQKVLKMNPDDSVTLGRLADMYRDRGMTTEAFEAYERLSANEPNNYLYLDYLMELGRKLGRPKSFRVGLLNRMLKLQPDNLRVIELLIEETGSMRLLNRALRLDPRSGKLNYLKGEHYFGVWKKASTPKDSVEALAWFKKALSDPQWQGNAQRMINELDPPLTEEEKMLREFFKKKEKKEAVGQKGKK